MSCGKEAASCDEGASGSDRSAGFLFHHVWMVFARKGTFSQTRPVFLIVELIQCIKRVKAMGKQKRKNTAASRDIPYERCYEEAGMIETDRGVYTHAYEIIPPKKTKEMTYSRERARDGIRKIFRLASKGTFQFVIRNARIPVNDYLEKIQLKAAGNASLQTHIEAYNGFLSKNVAIGHNNHESRVYLAISTDGTDAGGAMEEFDAADIAISQAFDELYGDDV